MTPFTAKATQLAERISAATTEHEFAEHVRLIETAFAEEHSRGVDYGWKSARAQQERVEDKLLQAYENGTLFSPTPEQQLMDDNAFDLEREQIEQGGAL